MVQIFLVSALKFINPSNDKEFMMKISVNVKAFGVILSKTRVLLNTNPADLTHAC